MTAHNIRSVNASSMIDEDAWSSCGNEERKRPESTFHLQRLHQIGSVSMVQSFLWWNGVKITAHNVRGTCRVSVRGIFHDRWRCRAKVAEIKSKKKNFKNTFHPQRLHRIAWWCCVGCRWWISPSTFEVLRSVVTWRFYARDKLHEDGEANSRDQRQRSWWGGFKQDAPSFKREWNRRKEILPVHAESSSRTVEGLDEIEGGTNESHGAFPFARSRVPGWKTTHLTHCDESGEELGNHRGGMKIGSTRERVMSPKCEYPDFSSVVLAARSTQTRNFEGRSRTCIWVGKMLPCGYEKSAAGNYRLGRLTLEYEAIRHWQCGPGMESSPPPRRTRRRKLGPLEGPRWDSHSFSDMRFRIPQLPGSSLVLHQLRMTEPAPPSPLPVTALFQATSRRSHGETLPGPRDWKVGTVDCLCRKGNRDQPNRQPRTRSTAKGRLASRGHPLWEPFDFKLAHGRSP